MPMVNVVEGAFCLSSPQRRNHGAPSSLPVRSCRAMSTAALPAATPSERGSMRVRISSVRKGSSNSSSTVCAFCRKAATLCGDPSSRCRYGGIEASPYPVTPSYSISTCMSGVVEREYVATVKTCRSWSS